MNTAKRGAGGGAPFLRRNSATVSSITASTTLQNSVHVPFHNLRMVSTPATVADADADAVADAGGEDDGEDDDDVKFSA